MVVPAGLVGLKHCPHCNAKLGRTGEIDLDLQCGFVKRTTIHVEFASCPRCGGVLEDYTPMPS